MARKKKPEAPTEPQATKSEPPLLEANKPEAPIEITPEPPVEPKVDYSELWFAERIGSKVEAVQGKDLNKTATLFHCFWGPFPTKEECLPTVEKKQAAIDAEIKLHKAIEAAEPDPIPFKKKEEGDTSESETTTAEKQPSKQQSNTNFSPNQVIMIPGNQAEVTVKFNSRPEVPEVGKTFLLEITTEQGITVRANVNRKTLKKQVEKMDSFTEWIAALSGKITRIDPNGVVELEGAGVVVFEKKAKEEVVSEVEIISTNVEV